jgi:D-sedoheptulose 7-phosphate isomerase
MDSMSADDISRIRRCVEESIATVASLAGQADMIAAASDTVVSALKAGCKVLTAGNGGSAAEALHMAEELTGRFRTDRVSLPGVCLAADGTALTCIANDYGYDEVFSRQIEGLGGRGDVLVLFSTSGGARNLSRALEAAHSRGVTVVAILGRDGGALKGKADHEILVEGSATERIQEAHQVIVHLILDAVEAAWTGGKRSS